ncbi:MAG: hypothetical protein KME11_05030 [Timaviella obliquedivisa GSE-PSE-MK23-08B]|jgi:hypothetical protein|nr:hypothetical protein [Timaviella obliquedivisa GSE-PSE-MK23-08B]
MDVLKKMDFERSLLLPEFRAGLRKTFTSVRTQFEYPCVVVFPSVDSAGRVIGQRMMGVNGELILPLLDEIPAKNIARRIIFRSDRCKTTPVVTTSRFPFENFAGDRFHRMAWQSFSVIAENADPLVIFDSRIIDKTTRR